MDEKQVSEEKKPSQDCNELIVSLPREKGWITPYLHLFQGFWYSSSEIQAISTFQNHFQAKDNDIVVASVPKSGTTWLKALTFAIVKRENFPSLENHPLLVFNPHELVPPFEFVIYDETNWQVHELPKMPEPRIFGTHVPFSSLAKSIKETNTKIVYICRNLFDTFISTWVFVNRIMPEFLPALPLEEAFERYCKGIIGFGPSWNHILGYWRESIARPDKVLFLKYEDVKEDVVFNVKKIAEFLGCPFTKEEESNGVIENIIKLCSFENMKELKVNKCGTMGKGRIVENKYFFRKAEMGDWVNYFSPSMVEKLSKIIEEKLSGSDLSFRVYDLNNSI
ncbi:cytosolic sulfotransferase 15-like [Vigna unguiculata]|uniref:cytosolic sulfotransferase 15-like n=1 Tax=Vigna unguiculata TaxID=3917 RepID=UPI001015D33A|nr:cytosolic sulfotransferase 15-like [Vigna unguiculata]